MISAVFRKVIVPPGWISWAGVLVACGARVTMPPCTGRALGDAAGFLVVAVVFFTVPLVVLAVVTDPLGAAVVLVVGAPPRSATVDVVAWVDDVVACVSAVLLLLPLP